MNSVTTNSRMRTLVNTVVGLVILAFVSALTVQAQNVSFASATGSVTEGGSLSVSVSLSGATSAIETVDYLVGWTGAGHACQANQNDATGGDDFVVASGTLTFPNGSSASQTFSVVTTDDSVRENPQYAKTLSECLSLRLSNESSGLTIVNPNIMRVDITDNEADAQLSIADASVAEDGGSASMSVSLTVPLDEDLDLAALAATYTNLTAESGDYTAGSDSGTLTAGNTSGTLSIPIVNDQVFEGDETVNVTMSASAAFDLADGVGKLTIVDDEGVPELSINDASAAEGANVAFTITKSHGAEAAYNITLSYTDVTATSISDYTPVTNVAVAAGDATTETVNVAAVNDSDVESTESFIVSIVDAAEYDVDGGNGNGLGTITDNDGIDIAVTVTLDAETILLNGAPSNTVTVVLTNNGAAAASSDITLAFSDTGFGTRTFTSYSGENGFSTTCDTAINSATCVLEDTDFTAGASETLVFTIAADGAAGSTAQITVSQSGNTETDVSNDAASDSASLLGLDFGDIGSTNRTSGTDDLMAPAGAEAAYHVISSDLKLGATVNAETSNSEDDAHTDDDGVVTLNGNLLKPGAGTLTNYLGVTVAGLGAGESAYVSILPNNPTDDFVAIDDYGVASNGITWIPIEVKSTANASADFRVRICDTENECDALDDIANDGEMEDYKLTVAALAATESVTIPTGTVEPVTLTDDGTDYVLVDGNGDTIFKGTEATITTAINLTGNSGANTLVVDINNLDTDMQINWDGGAGSDALELNDSGGSTLTLLTHTFTNATDGSIAGDALFDTNYMNLAPILDNLSAVNRVMTFGAGDDNIVLRDNGSSVDGMTFIDSNNSEQVTFANPTTSLTINAGAGADTIDYDGVDETAPNNTFSITFNGDSGADLFTILPTPVASSLGALTVAGGTPAVCPGDVLDIDTSGGAVIDNLTPTPVTFTGASHDAIAFSGIEAFADQSADVAISATSTAGTDLNAGDITTITLSVTNNGTDTASCVMVNDILLDGAFTLNSGPTFSVGSFTSPKWTIGSLASGDTATLTYTVTVGQTFNGSAAITVTSPESDPDTSNNSVTFTIEPAFEFPTKAQATAAAWFGTGANEHLVVGLANGFAGLNSSVLCRVPPATGFPANLWRECGNGLPYPLYVNDLYLDDQGTPADSSDDKLYLASWGSAGLYVSEDGGENFTAAEPDLGDHGATGWTNVYAIVEDVDGFLYISTNHGFVYRSLNNGATWQKIGDLPEVDADTPWSLASHPTENGRLYAGTFGRGVYTSDDYGFTWSFLGGSAVNQLLINDDGGHIFDLELTPSSNAAGGFIFAATGGGVFRMAVDGDGESAGLWDMLDTDVTLNSGTVTPEARALAFDMSEDLYVTTWGHGAFFSAAPTVATSMTQIALRGANVSFVAVNPAGDQVIFGTEAQGVIIMPVASSTDTEPIAGADETTLPSGYVLNQNYPNPFNPVTTISFALPETGQVRLSVYDVLGREVKVLVNGTAQAGQHEVQFDAAGLPTGTYIYRLETDKGSFAKQLVLMK